METVHAELLKLGPMARRLGVSTSWLRAESDVGRIPCLKDGKRYLYSPVAVFAAVADIASRPDQLVKLAESLLATRGQMLEVLADFAPETEAGRIATKGIATIDHALAQLGVEVPL